MDNLSETDKFERLYTYQFVNNPRFVEGWSRVVNVIPQEELFESLIKAQVFFFTREVEEVSLEGYKRWLEDNNKNKDIPEELLNIRNLDRTHQAAPASEQSPNEPLLTNTDNEVDSMTGKHPANFSELIYMIQNGIKLPDTDDLNIEPTNEEPSPGQLGRLKKPWET